MGGTLPDPGVEASWTTDDGGNVFLVERRLVEVDLVVDVLLLHIRQAASEVAGVLLAGEPRRRRVYIWEIRGNEIVNAGWHVAVRALKVENTQANLLHVVDALGAPCGLTG
jgi:hypothetical protein